MQENSCGPSKQMVLIYLAKNNNNDIIQRVSDEDEIKECEFCSSLYPCMDFVVDFLILRFRGQQNLTFIFRREGKYEKKN
jgi:hypothetical protein